MNSPYSSGSQIKDLLQHARQVLLVTKAPATLDGAAACLALAGSIKRFGREVTLVTPGELSEPVRGLPGATLFATSLTPRGLVITLENEPNSVSKVNYETVGNKFNLVVTPAPGHDFTADQVSFAKTGSSHDLVIVLDTADLPLLGKLYEAEQAAWASLPLLNIDRHPANTQYGRVNVLDHEASSTCEVTARIMIAAKLPLPRESAELLLLGIRDASSNFQNAGPGTFELAATLTRHVRGQGSVESTEERLVNEPFRKVSAGNPAAKAIS